MTSNKKFAKHFLCGAVLVGYLLSINTVNKANAAEYRVDSAVGVTGVADWDVLNIRKWPNMESHKVGAAAPSARVWVNRCLTKSRSSDWCHISWMHQSGWVNSRYLRLP